MKIAESNANLIAAALYTGVSSSVALGVFTGALIADYDWVARIGGSVWAFFLAMVILMPIVIPLTRSWATGEKMQMASHDHDAMLREQAERKRKSG